MEHLPEWLEGLIYAVGGAFLTLGTAVLRAWFRLKGDKIDDISEFRSQILEDNAQLRQQMAAERKQHAREIQEYRERIDRLEARIVSLEAR